MQYYATVLQRAFLLFEDYTTPGKYGFLIKSRINGLIFLKDVLLIPNKRRVWTGLAFRRNVMYFLSLESWQISMSQIFIFIFFTLISLISNFRSGQPCLSRLVYHLKKNLGKSIKSKCFIAKTKIPAKYFETDFK